MSGSSSSAFSAPLTNRPLKGPCVIAGRSGAGMPCLLLAVLMPLLFLQATHYSFLATLEVLGKMMFSAFVGSLVDWLGFLHAFCVFLAFSLASILYTLPAVPART